MTSEPAAWTIQNPPAPSPQTRNSRSDRTVRNSRQRPAREPRKGCSGLGAFGSDEKQRHSPKGSVREPCPPSPPHLPVPFRKRPAYAYRGERGPARYKGSWGLSPVSARGPRPCRGPPRSGPVDGSSGSDLLRRLLCADAGTAEAAFKLGKPIARLRREPDCHRQLSQLRRFEERTADRLADERTADGLP
jgi:hypothetical protein